MKKIIAAFALVLSTIVGVTTAQVTLDTAPSASAVLYNCSVWYEYNKAKGNCASFNSTAPIQTRYYVYTKCTNPIQPDYWVAGNFVSFPAVSTATCASYFKPVNAYLIKTA